MGAGAALKLSSRDFPPVQPILIDFFAMADALGTSAAGLRLFETVIIIFKRINKAYKRQKELSTTVDGYRQVLESINLQVEEVKNEKDLEGANVSPTLERLEKLKMALSALVDKVDPRDKPSIYRFGEQLVNGTKDRKELDKIMKGLEEVKVDLSSVIQIHQTRMLAQISRTMSAKAPKPKKGRNGTGAAKVVLPAPGQPTGLATPSDTDASSIDSDSETDSDDGTSSERSSGSSTCAESSPSTTSDKPFHRENDIPTIRKVRIEKNKTMVGAWMFNGPLGENTWTHVKSITIRENIAEKDSVMFNTPVDERGLGIAERAMAFSMKQQECRQKQRQQR